MFGVMTAMLEMFEYTKGEPTMASHDFPLRKDLRKHNIMYVPHLCHKDGVGQIDKLYGGAFDAPSQT
jgi:hypothetical protein